jgi:hypothetical protein
MYWVAKTGKREWNSNRTRDAVDLAFTIRETSDGGADLEIRRTYTDDPTRSNTQRARWTIGHLHYSDVSTAKYVVENQLKAINVSPVGTLQENRTKLVEDLLIASNSSYGDHGSDAYVVLNGKVITQRNLMVPLVPATPAPTRAPESIAADIQEIMDTLSNAFAESEPVTTVPTVKEIDVNDYKPGDPAPAGYIWLGKKLTKIAFPS